MNSNDDAEVSTEPTETCALPRAGSRSSPVIKAANVCAQNRGVEVILANHRCRGSATAPPPTTPAEDEVQCNSWELAGLLGFVVLSFVGMFFCFYVISAKCRGTWSF